MRLQVHNWLHCGETSGNIADTASIGFMLSISDGNCTCWFETAVEWVVVRELNVAWKLVLISNPDEPTMKLPFVSGRRMFISNVFILLRTPGFETNNNFTCWTLTGTLDVLGRVVLAVRGGDFDTPTDEKNELN